MAADAQWYFGVMPYVPTALDVNLGGIIGSCQFRVNYCKSD